MAGEGLAGKARREWVGGGGLWPCGLKKISTRTRAPRRNCTSIDKGSFSGTEKIPRPEPVRHIGNERFFKAPAQQVGGMPLEASQAAPEGVGCGACSVEPPGPGRGCGGARGRRAMHATRPRKHVRAHLHTCTPAHLRTCAPAHLRTCAPARVAGFVAIDQVPSSCWSTFKEGPAIKHGGH